MRTTFERGVVAVTVLVPAAPPRSMAGGIPALAHLLSRYKLPAAWAVAAGSHETLAAIHEGAGPSEIALWATEAWSGPNVPRSQFASRLGEYLGVIRAQGCAIQTLVMSGPPRADRFDLLVKHGICAIGAVDASGRATRAAAVAQLRHGLFAIAARAFAPARRTSWLSTPERAFRRQLQQAAANRGVLHVAIDALEIAAGGTAEMARLERLLRRAAEFVARGQLEAATLAAVADRLMPARQSPPARSILRSAA